MVMVKMVKIDFHLSKSATIINIIYLYIVSQMTESENENDQNDLDHFDRRMASLLLAQVISLR